MPHVRVLGTTDDGSTCSFDLEGGCFCILGRDLSNLGYIEERLEDRDIESLKTMRYLLPEFKSRKKQTHDVLLALRSRFSFMRTLVTDTDTLHTRGYFELDIENYTLNEVMHCLFWLRHFFCHGFSVGHYMDLSEVKYIAYSELIENRGYTEEQAFMLCMLPRESKNWINSRQISLEGPYEGDEQVLLYSAINSRTLLSSALYGVTVSDHYWTPLTLQQHVENVEKYTQNMSKLLCSSAIRPRSDTAVRFWKDFLSMFSFENNTFKTYFGIEKKRTPSNEKIREVMNSLVDKFPEYLASQTKNRKLGRVLVTKGHNPQVLKPESK